MRPFTSTIFIIVTSPNLPRPIASLSPLDIAPPLRYPLCRPMALLSHKEGAPMWKKALSRSSLA
jgi:hypothetical protein